MKMPWVLIVVAAVYFAGFSSAFAVYKPDANAPRSSVPEQYKWDLSRLVPSDDAWEKAFARAQKGIADFSKHQGKLNAPKNIRAALDDYFSVSQVVSQVASYANLRVEEDDSQAAYQGLKQRALDQGQRWRAAASFLRQELLRMDEKAMTAMLQDQSMAPYRLYVADLRRRRAHLLGDEAEKVLGLAGENLWSETDLNEIPSDVELIFKAARRDIALPNIIDEQGKSVPLTLSNYSKYRASKDRRVRREAVQALLGTLKKHENILAGTFGAEIKRDVFMAHARGYERSVDAYLDRENVPAHVLENMIAAVHANLAPLHRYVKLRKKLLKLSELHYYDLYTPLVPSVDFEIPYDAGLKDVKEALKPLGKEYSADLEGPKMLGRRMIDVFPNKGKSSGAFAHSQWGFPPLIQLNYMDDLEDVSTTAHELGHAMHAFMNMKAQAMPDFGSASLVAEIASTFNEMLLSKYYLAKYKKDPKRRVYLLGRLLESIRTTIYRQSLFAEFELKTHGFAEKGVPMTAELLNKTYTDLVKLYYGPDFIVDVHDGVEWAYVPHFYWKHYVFSYACGLASGIAFSEKISSGDSKARDKYLAMLGKPRSAHPVEIIKEAGVDLMKPDAIASAARLMNRVMDEMEALSKR